MTVPYGEAFRRSPSSPSSSSNGTTDWGPYSSGGEFGASMLVILVVLFSSLILALALIAALRFLLCVRRAAGATDVEKQTAGKEMSTVEVLPTLVFSAGTQLAGTEAVCAICLSDFVEGDRVWVLPACSHGFHVKCIQGWLALRFSCPTCRSYCRVAAGRRDPEVAA